MVYASSIHTVSGYPEDVQVKAEEPVNQFGIRESRHMLDRKTPIKQDVCPSNWFARALR